MFIIKNPQELKLRLNNWVNYVGLDGNETGVIFDIKYHDR